MRLKGFTFIEVILVTSIILIVAVYTSWLSVRFLVDRRVTTSVQVLRESLGRASLYALTGKSGTDWGVVQVGSSIVIFSGTTFANRYQSQDETILVPAGITISGLGQVIFEASTGVTTARTINIEGAGFVTSLILSGEGAVQSL